MSEKHKDKHAKSGQESRHEWGKQMQDAMDWCAATGKGASAACNGPHAEQWPLVRESTLRDRLKERVHHGREYEAERLLGVEHEAQIARWLIYRGRNWDPVSRTELKEVAGNVVRAKLEMDKKQIPVHRRNHAQKLMLASHDHNPGRAYVEAFSKRHEHLLVEKSGRVIVNKRLNLSGCQFRHYSH
jgi:hypothetical protein